MPALKSLTRAQLLDRIATARRGEVIRYHTGFLCIDRELDRDVERVAYTAIQATEAGHVFLFQRRLGDAVYEYLAVKRDPAVPIVWNGCYDPDASQYIKPKVHRLERRFRHSDASLPLAA